jgi:hypothetical protein
MNNYFHRTAHAHGRRDTTIYLPFYIYNTIYIKNPISIEVFLICPTNASFSCVFSSVYLYLFVTVVLAADVITIFFDILALEFVQHLEFR